MEGQENLHKLNILIKRVDIAPPPFTPRSPIYLASAAVDRLNLYCFIFD